MYRTMCYLLITIEGGIPPNDSDFCRLYKKGSPPSAQSKIKVVTRKLKANQLEDLSKIFDEIFDSKIRNAVQHADYIIFDGKLRLKHKGSEIEEITFEEISIKISKLLSFLGTFMEVLEKHKRSYKEGDVIKNRKSSDGERNLADIELIVENGKLVGISCSDLLPFW